MSKKERLDLLLFSKGLVSSRERAKTTIMSGLVFVNNNRVDKPGTMVDIDSDILIKGDPIGYVSRGGLKLEKAIKSFNLNLNGVVAMDAGASTGGFTDCMLKNGASKVYAVDVGYGQLAWSLRNDERVICMERTNVRYLTHETIPDSLDFISADLSFISLKLLFPVFRELIAQNGCAVCLVKPQFEAGREKVGKKGVVSDPETHKEVILKVMNDAVECGFSVIALDYSPIKGPEGNIEYLVLLSPDNEPKILVENPDSVVKNAHAELDRRK